MAELAHLVADAIVQAHLTTMLRLDVEYDVLPRESEILHLKFWAVVLRAAEGAQGDLLRDRRQERRLLGDAAGSRERGQGDRALRRHGRLYVGKDIAYQLWKFGLLGKDFYYRPLQTYADGRVLWVTTDQPARIGPAVRARARACTT